MSHEPHPVVVAISASEGEAGVLVARYTARERAAFGSLLGRQEPYARKIIVEELLRFPAAGDCEELRKWLDRQIGDPRTLVGSAAKAGLVQVLVDGSDYTGGPTLIWALSDLRRNLWTRRVRAARWDVVEQDDSLRQGDFAIRIARREIAAAIDSRIHAKELKVSKGRYASELQDQINGMRRRPNPGEESREDLARGLGMALYWFKWQESHTEHRICPSARAIA